MGPENEDPRNDPEPRPEKPTFNYTTTQTDPELSTIEGILFLLRNLPADRRVRALTYIRDRIESDPEVWGTAIARPELTPAERQKIALALAGGDATTWNLLPTEAQENYCLRAEALFYGSGIRAPGA